MLDFYKVKMAEIYDMGEKKDALAELEKAMPSDLYQSARAIVDTCSEGRPCDPYSDGAFVAFKLIKVAQESPQNLAQVVRLLEGKGARAAKSIAMRLSPYMMNRQPDLFKEALEIAADQPEETAGDVMGQLASIAKNDPSRFEGFASRYRR